MPDDPTAASAGAAGSAANPPMQPGAANPSDAGDAGDAGDASASELSPADQAAIDELLKQATLDEPSAGASARASQRSAAAEQAEPDAADSGEPIPDPANFDLPSFQQVVRESQVSNIELLRDVELSVKIELGRSRMLVEDVLKLGEGSVVELDKLAGDPVDVFVNDRLVARGEVLVLNDNFCVRVNEIVAGLKDEGT
jgi:flagellar motor switch protein FliN/FliY